MYEQVAHNFKSKLKISNQDMASSYYLLVTWILTNTLIVIMLLNGVRSSGHFKITRYIAHVQYVLLLLWYLGRKGPSLRELPDVKSIMVANREMGKFIPTMGIASLFILAFMEGNCLAKSNG
jgi:hypothetical protein